MILVTGATGSFGQAAIEFLLKKGVPAQSIVALARNLEKAQALQKLGVGVRTGDYDDQQSLERAMKDVDQLLFVSGSDIEKRMQQHENVVAAAKAAGVKHIAYTSVARSSDDVSNSPIAFVSQSHIQTEKLIRASGIAYTFLQNGLYADMLPVFFGDRVLETGIFLPAGDGKAAFTTRRDMAEAAAAVLATKGHENKAYRIVSPVEHTMAELASTLSELTGKKIGYLKPDVATFHETMKKLGVPDAYIGAMAGFSQAIDRGELTSGASDLERLTGHPATTMREFLGSVYR